MLRPLFAMAAAAVLACAAPPPTPPPASPPLAERVDPARPTPPPAPRPQTTPGCTTDAQCPGGQVCEGCGGPKECVPGCHQSSQCPGGKCVQVQCIRCPCPGQCR